MLVTLCVVSMLSFLEAYPVRNKTNVVSYSGSSNDVFAESNHYKNLSVYKDWDRFMNRGGWKTFRVVNYEYLG